MRYRIIFGVWFLVVACGVVGRCFASSLSGSADLSSDRAQRLLDAGVYSEAADVLTAYTRVHTNDVGARYALARLLFDLQRFDQAIDEALAIPRNDSVYGPSRQHLLMRLRLRAAHAVDWRDPEAVLSFARLCSRMGSYERSVRAYRHLLSLDAPPPVRREYAAVLGWIGDARSAARQWARYLEDRPEDWDAWHQLARADMSLGNLAAAERHLETLLERQPDNPPVMLDLARVRIWRGEVASADRLLAAIWATDAAPVEAGILRAELLLRLGEVETAHGVLREVLEQAPRNRPARAMLQDLEASRRVDIARLRRRIEQVPDDTADRIRLIDILLAVDRPGAALREMSALVALRPDDRALADRVADLEARQRRDIERMMRRLAGAVGLADRYAILQEWPDRHPDDLRALRLIDQQSALISDETPISQP